MEKKSKNDQEKPAEFYQFTTSWEKHEALHLKMLSEDNKIKLHIQTLRSIDKCKKTRGTNPVLMYEMLQKERLLDSLRDGRKTEKKKQNVNQPVEAL